MSKLIEPSRALAKDPGQKTDPSVDLGKEQLPEVVSRREERHEIRRIKHELAKKDDQEWGLTNRDLSAATASSLSAVVANGSTLGRSIRSSTDSHRQAAQSQDAAAADLSVNKKRKRGYGGASHEMSRVLEQLGYEEVIALSIAEKLTSANATKTQGATPAKVGEILALELYKALQGLDLLNRLGVSPGQDAEKQKAEALAKILVMIQPVLLGDDVDESKENSDQDGTTPPPPKDPVIIGSAKGPGSDFVAANVATPKGAPSTCPLTRDPATEIVLPTFVPELLVCDRDTDRRAAAILIAQIVVHVGMGDDDKKTPENVARFTSAFLDRLGVKGDTERQLVSQAVTDELSVQREPMFRQRVVEENSSRKALIDEGSHLQFVRNSLVPGGSVFAETEGAVGELHTEFKESGEKTIATIQEEALARVAAGEELPVAYVVAYAEAVIGQKLSLAEARAFAQQLEKSYASGLVKAYQSHHTPAQLRALDSSLAQAIDLPTAISTLEKTFPGGDRRIFVRTCQEDLRQAINRQKDAVGSLIAAATRFGFSINGTQLSTPNSAREAKLDHLGNLNTCIVQGSAVLSSFTRTADSPFRIPERITDRSLKLQRWNQEQKKEKAPEDPRPKLVLNNFEKSEAVIPHGSTPKRGANIPYGPSTPPEPKKASTNQRDSNGWVKFEDPKDLIAALKAKPDPRIDLTDPRTPDEILKGLGSENKDPNSNKHPFHPGRPPVDPLSESVTVTNGKVGVRSVPLVSRNREDDRSPSPRNRAASLFTESPGEGKSGPDPILEMTKSRVTLVVGPSGVRVKDGVTQIDEDQAATALGPKIQITDVAKQVAADLTTVRTTHKDAPTRDFASALLVAVDAAFVEPKARRAVEGPAALGLGASEVKPGWESQRRPNDPIFVKIAPKEIIANEKNVDPIDLTHDAAGAAVLLFEEKVSADFDRALKAKDLFALEEILQTVDEVEPTLRTLAGLSERPLYDELAQKAKGALKDWTRDSSGSASCEGLAMALREGWCSIDEIGGKMKHLGALKEFGELIGGLPKIGVAPVPYRESSTLWGFDEIRHLVTSSSIKRLAETEGMSGGVRLLRVETTARTADIGGGKSLTLGPIESPRVVTARDATLSDLYKAAFGVKEVDQPQLREFVLASPELSGFFAEKSVESVSIVPAGTVFSVAGTPLGTRIRSAALADLKKQLASELETAKDEATKSEVQNELATIEIFELRLEREALVLKLARQMQELCDAMPDVKAIQAKSQPNADKTSQLYQYQFPATPTWQDEILKADQALGTLLHRSIPACREALFATTHDLVQIEVKLKARVASLEGRVKGGDKILEPALALAKSELSACHDDISAMRGSSSSLYVGSRAHPAPIQFLISMMFTVRDARRELAPTVLLAQYASKPAVPQPQTYQPWTSTPATQPQGPSSWTFPPPTTEKGLWNIPPIVVDQSTTVETRAPEATKSPEDPPPGIDPFKLPLGERYSVYETAEMVDTLQRLAGFCASSDQNDLLLRKAAQLELEEAESAAAEIAYANDDKYRATLAQRATRHYLKSAEILLEAARGKTPESTEATQLIAAANSLKSKAYEVRAVAKVDEDDGIKDLGRSLSYVVTGDESKAELFAFTSAKRTQDFELKEDFSVWEGWGTLYVLKGFEPDEAKKIGTMIARLPEDRRARAMDLLAQIADRYAGRYESKGRKEEYGRPSMSSAYRVMQVANAAAEATGRLENWPSIPAFLGSKERFQELLTTGSTAQTVFTTPSTEQPDPVLADLFYRNDEVRKLAKEYVDLQKEILGLVADYGKQGKGDVSDVPYPARVGPERPDKGSEKVSPKEKIKAINSKMEAVNEKWVDACKKYQLPKDPVQTSYDRETYFSARMIAVRVQVAFADPKQMHGRIHREIETIREEIRSPKGSSGQSSEDILKQIETIQKDGDSPLTTRKIEILKVQLRAAQIREARMDIVCARLDGVQISTWSYLAAAKAGDASLSYAQFVDNFVAEVKIHGEEMIKRAERLLRADGKLSDDEITGELHRMRAQVRFREVNTKFAAVQAYALAGHNDKAKTALDELERDYRKDIPLHMSLQIQKIKALHKNGSQWGAAIVTTLNEAQTGGSLGQSLAFCGGGAAVGAGIGVWFGGVGALPGAFIGGLVGLCADKGYNIYNGRGRIGAAFNSGVSGISSAETVMNCITLGVDVVTVFLPVKGMGGVVGKVGARGLLGQGLKAEAKAVLKAELDQGFKRAGVEGTKTLTNKQMTAVSNQFVRRELMEGLGSHSGKLLVAQVVTAGGIYGYNRYEIESDTSLTPELRSAAIDHLNIETIKASAVLIGTIAVTHAASRRFAPSPLKRVETLTGVRDLTPTQKAAAQEVVKKWGGAAREAVLNGGTIKTGPAVGDITATKTSNGGAGEARGHPTETVQARPPTAGKDPVKPTETPPRVADKAADSPPKTHDLKPDVKAADKLPGGVAETPKGVTGNPSEKNTATRPESSKPSTQKPAQDTPVLKGETTPAKTSPLAETAKPAETPPAAAPKPAAAPETATQSRHAPRDFDVEALPDYRDVPMRNADGSYRSALQRLLDAGRQGPSSPGSPPPAVPAETPSSTPMKMNKAPRGTPSDAGPSILDDILAKTNGTPKSSRTTGDTLLDEIIAKHHSPHEPPGIDPIDIYQMKVAPSDQGGAKPSAAPKPSKGIPLSDLGFVVESPVPSQKAAPHPSHPGPQTAGNGGGTMTAAPKLQLRAPGDVSRATSPDYEQRYEPQKRPSQPPEQGNFGNGLRGSPAYEPLVTTKPAQSKPVQKPVETPIVEPQVTEPSSPKVVSPSKEVKPVVQPELTPRVEELPAPKPAVDPQTNPLHEKAPGGQTPLQAQREVLPKPREATDPLVAPLATTKPLQDPLPQSKPQARPQPQNVRTETKVAEEETRKRESDEEQSDSASSSDTPSRLQRREDDQIEIAQLTAEEKTESDAPRRSWRKVPLRFQRRMSGPRNIGAKDDAFGGDRASGLDETDHNGANIGEYTVLVTTSVEPNAKKS